MVGRPFSLVDRFRFTTVEYGTSSALFVRSRRGRWAPFADTHATISDVTRHFFVCFRDRDLRILRGQQPELGVRAVRSAGRSAGARLYRAMFLELGADGHVLPVQATDQGMRRRLAGASRDYRRARQMFPDAQRQNKLTSWLFFFYFYYYLGGGERRRGKATFTMRTK